jgi:hypothetical protein
MARTLIKTELINEALVFAWKAYKNNLVFFIGLLSGLMLFYSGQDLSMVKMKGDLAFFIPLLVFIFILNNAAAIGLTNVSLLVSENKKASYADLFSQQQVFFKYLASWALYILIVAAGLVLLIVPGIIWSIKFMFYKFLVVEKEYTPVESLKLSAELTKPYIWELFLLETLLICLNISGFLVFGLGLFITIPVSLVANAFVYKRLIAKMMVPTVSTII